MSPLRWVSAACCGFSWSIRFFRRPPIRPLPRNTSCTIFVVHERQRYFSNWHNWSHPIPSSFCIPLRDRRSRRVVGVIVCVAGAGGLPLGMTTAITRTTLLLAMGNPYLPRDPWESRRPSVGDRMRARDHNRHTYIPFIHGNVHFEPHNQTTATTTRYT